MEGCDEDPETHTPHRTTFLEVLDTHPAAVAISSDLGMTDLGSSFIFLFRMHPLLTNLPCLLYPLTLCRRLTAVATDRADTMFFSLSQRYLLLACTSKRALTKEERRATEAGLSSGLACLRVWPLQPARAWNDLLAWFVRGRKKESRAAKQSVWCSACECLPCLDFRSVESGGEGYE